VVPEDELPKSPEDWIRVADRELGNIVGSYKGGLTGDAKIDHAVKATEAMLKATFWKFEKISAWPGKNVSQYNWLYKHNLDVFLDRCGLRTRLKANPALRASWQSLVNASVKQHRYLPNSPSDAEANEVVKSARHPDVGIVPWLKKQYEAMS
jgi:hypothetical protein